MDPSEPFGSGDQWVAGHLDLPTSIVIVDKIDAVTKDRVIGQLGAASSLGASDYFPVSAKSGEGIAALVSHLTALMPEGPLYFPTTPSAISQRRRGSPNWSASSCWRSPTTNCHTAPRHGDRMGVAAHSREIIVERESQKGMVIGGGGSILKKGGRQARPRPASRRRLPRTVRQGRQGLAAPTRSRRAPRLLTTLYPHSCDILRPGWSDRPRTGYARSRLRTLPLPVLGGSRAPPQRPRHLVGGQGGGRGR